MPKIVISEIDNTKAGVNAQSTDIVYVPGFVDLTLAQFTRVTDPDTPLAVNTPTIFNDLDTFKTMCGITGAKFAEAQTYASLSTAGSFASNAIPTGETPVLFAANSYDPGWTMAAELLSQGLSVCYERVNASTDTISALTMYQALNSLYTTGTYLEDKGTYQFKYLTSGGYPVFEFSSVQTEGDPALNAIVTSMLKLASDRGDCVAFIDHTDNPGRSIKPTDTSSVYYVVSHANLTNGEYGTMMTPWMTYNSTVSSSTFRMPGSYAYFECLAKSLKNQNANWLAIAGSARGVVPYINNMDTLIPNGIADKVQPRDGVAINPITVINPFGITLWGNRTLKNNSANKNLTATSFLNIRNLCSDVKKVAYDAAKTLTFEQNNEVLWANFKAYIAPTLDKMLSGYGLSGYKIIKDLNHPKANEKATLTAKIILYPVYAVEDFYITVLLEDEDVTIVEG